MYVYICIYRERDTYNIYMEAIIGTPRDQLGFTGMSWQQALRGEQGGTSFTYNYSV